MSRPRIAAIASFVVALALAAALETVAVAQARNDVANPAHPADDRAGIVAGMAAAAQQQALAAADAPADQQHKVVLSFCDAAPDGGTEAFGLGRDRGMLVRADCRSSGSNKAGVMTRTAQTSKKFKVRYQGYSAAVFQAAPGTVIRTIHWGGFFARRNCDWLVQLRIVDGTDPRHNKLLRGFTNASRCPAPGKAQAARAHDIETFNVATSPKYAVPNPTTIIQRVICRRRDGCPIGADAKAFMVSPYLQVELADTAPPENVQFTGGNIFAGWVNGARDVSFVASDQGSGVQSVRVLGEPTAPGQPETQLAGFPRACQFSRRIACDNGGGSLTVNTASVPRQGTQNIWLEATDPAGNVTRSAPHPISVDTLAPGATAVSVTPEPGDLPGTGQEWRNTPSFNLTWSNSDQQGDVAPVAGYSYSICPHQRTCADVQNAQTGQPVDQVTVTAQPGEQDFKVWRADAAGNSSQNNASVPVTLRYDPVAPKATFDSVSKTDPTLLTGAVSDEFSGVDNAQIEINQVGSTSWEAVPTQRNADGHIEARVNDIGRAPGLWVARATVHDRAGNTYISPPDQQLAFAVPMRTETRLSAELVDRETVKKRIGRKGKRRVVRRTITTHRTDARAPFGQQVQVRGTLADVTGKLVGGATIELYATTDGAGERLLGTAVTDPQGVYTYPVSADSTQTIRAHYPGTLTILPTDGLAHLTVPAATTFGVSRKKVPNGHSVVFSGRVLSGPLGPQGKNLNLEVKIGKGKPWTSFGDSPHADATGRWQLRYKFTRIAVNVRLRFRAVVPSEIGYPFATGISRPLSVIVLGASGKGRRGV